ncbi:hypothetical protein Bhyg_16277 [Pseudolycoriella hygida]|uniref:Uncharacterized protein n=1 Tax=Pseudolycoriella hygida TaxID=35572 RepID=A0A9Q0ML85_9DIPT|nr:hypothetical protein Bhyg_16277 [Pseudolycoriella hygida]
MARRYIELKRCPKIMSKISKRATRWSGYQNPTHPRLQNSTSSISKECFMKRTRFLQALSGIIHVIASRGIGRKNGKDGKHMA